MNFPLAGHCASHNEETASKVLLWESQHGQQTLTPPKLTLDWTIPKKKRSNARSGRVQGFY